MYRLTHSVLGLMLIVTSVGAAGQILLKIGMSQAGNQAPSLLGIVKIMLTQPLVFFGLVLFALNTILYLRVVQQHSISLVYPMLAFSYVMVTLLGRFVLGEAIPPLRVVGLLIIVAGVLLMAVSGNEERLKRGEFLRALTSSGGSAPSPARSETSLSEPPHHP